MYMDVYVCRCVYVYVYVHVCICACVFTHVYMCMHVGACLEGIGRKSNAGKDQRHQIL